MSSSVSITNCYSHDSQLGNKNLASIYRATVAGPDMSVKD